jgi:hypothetical protein
MTDFDPTTNLIQYAFLNEDSRKSLKNWPWGWEFYSFRQGGWSSVVRSAWCDEIVYRGKPAPAVKSMWCNIYPKGTTGLFTDSRKETDSYAEPHRIAVLRIDTCNGVSTAHLEDV